MEIALRKLVTVGERETVRPRELSEMERGLVDQAMYHDRLYGIDCHRLPILTKATAPVLADLVAVLHDLADQSDDADDLRRGHDAVQFQQP